MHDSLKQQPSRVVAAVVMMALLTLVSCSENGHVSVYTPFEELTFVDPVLRECVLSEAEQHNWKQSGQMTRLICTNAEGDAIKSLEGVEKLTAFMESFASQHG